MSDSNVSTRFVVLVPANEPAFLTQIPMFRHYTPSYCALTCAPLTLRAFFSGRAPVLSYLTEGGVAVLCPHQSCLSLAEGWRCCSLPLRSIWLGCRSGRPKKLGILRHLLQGGLALLRGGRGCLGLLRRRRAEDISIVLCNVSMMFMFIMYAMLLLLNWPPGRLGHPRGGSDCNRDQAVCTYAHICWSRPMHVRMLVHCTTRPYAHTYAYVHVHILVHTYSWMCVWST